MNNWYTVKVKYTKQLDNGTLKRVTEPYLLDAVSFTDAEARIYLELGTSIKGEFLVTGIAQTNFSDVFNFEDCDDWYKCKVTYQSEDADSGKSKKVSNMFLVTANNVKEAYERITESLDSMLVGFEIPQIMLTPIIEVFPYNPDLDVELDRRPMTEDETEEFESTGKGPVFSAAGSDLEDEDEAESTFEDVEEGEPEDLEE